MTLKSKILGLGAIAMMAVASTVSAADWKPNGPLTIQIGFGAGGSTDTMGRVLANVMEENTGWNIVVENKPGAGGVAMFTGLSQRPANGKTIGMGVSIPVLVQLVNRGDAPFDDLEGMIAYSNEQGGMPVATMAPPQVLMMKQTMAASGA